MLTNAEEPATVAVESEPVPTPSLVQIQRRAVNFRSVLLGVFGVLFICGLAPYNDFVVANTFLVGNYLPIGLVLFFLFFTLLVNAPLSRFRPALAFSAGELSVALGMTLISCSLPSSGLMRYLSALLVCVPQQAASQQDYLALFNQLHLPTWLFPTLHGTTVASRAHDPVITGYLRRIPTEHDTFVEHLMAIPWGAWLQPAVGWGILLRQCMAPWAALL